MAFIDEFIEELNKVPTYTIDNGKDQVITIRCDLVCDILTILLDKYGIGESDDIS